MTPVVHQQTIFEVELFPQNYTIRLNSVCCQISLLNKIESERLFGGATRYIAYNKRRAFAERDGITEYETQDTCVKPYRERTVPTIIG